MKKANDDGYTLDEYNLYTALETIILKKHFRGREGDLQEKIVREKMVDILDNL